MDVMDKEPDAFLGVKRFNEWKKKRLKTLVGYIIIGAIVGIDYSVILSTIYVYLRDVVATTSPQFYYGFIIAAYNISSTIFGVISGRWVDKTRKMRLYINIVCIIQMIGSVMYMIPYSVAFPVFGRLLAGIGDPFVNVCSGEVIRIFDDKGGTQALWWLASTYSIGFIVGPGLSVFFKYINFNIGPLNVNYLNFVGLFMAGMSMVALFVANTLIHDCSSEFDLKEYMKTYGEENEKIIGSSSAECDELFSSEELSESSTFINDSKSKEIPLFMVIKGLATNFDSILLFVSTFVFMFCLFGTDLMIPLLVSDTFHWDVVAVSYIFLAYGIVYFFILIIMARSFSTNKSVYYSCLLCITCQLLQYVALLMIKLTNRNNTRDIAIFVMFLLCWVIGWCIEEVLIRTMVGKMVPSCIQSFTETLRSGLARISTIFVSFAVPLLMPVVQWYSIVVIAIMFIILVCFIVRMKHLKSPSEIKFEM